MKKKKVGFLNKIGNRISLGLSLLNDWRSGAYKKAPVRSFTMMTLGLIYLVSPADIVSDFVPLLGIVDDAAILGFALKQMDKDLEAYKLWKDKGSR